MTTAELSVFFASLSLACWAATVGVATVFFLAARRPAGSAALLADDLARVGLWLAWLVATVTTLGSLYFSEIAHFTPCKLCWFQRIAMYPLSFTLFALYHTQLQAFPSQHSSFCSTLEPCTVRYVWEFGFVSLPFMALSAFVFIITMTILVGRHRPVTTEEMEVS